MIYFKSIFLITIFLAGVSSFKEPEPTLREVLTHLEFNPMNQPGENKQTLIIGGGLSGIHMGYRMQQRREPVVIWEMSDDLGGKARAQYKEEDITLDTGGNALVTKGYREFYLLAEELGMKNHDDLKRHAPSTIVDPVVACFMAKGFGKCDMTGIPDRELKLYTAPMVGTSWYLGRGLMLMQQEGYFVRFVKQSTMAGYDWTSPTFPEKLPILFAQTILQEINTFGKLMASYTDNAYEAPDDLDNHFNKYGFPKKTDEAKIALDQTILSFLQENDLYFFRVVAEYYYENMGYGLFRDTPLYYFIQWFSPQMIQFFEGILTKAHTPENFDGGIYTLKHGISGLLNSMVEEANLEVIFRRKVTRVDRIKNHQVFKVYYEQVSYKNGEKVVETGAQYFDRVISGMSSQQFVQIYNKGHKIHQAFTCRHSSSWVANVVDVTPNAALASAFDYKNPVFSGADSEDTSMLMMDFLTIKGSTSNKNNDNQRKRVQVLYDNPFRKVGDRCPASSTKRKLNQLSGNRSQCPSTIALQGKQLGDYIDEKLFGNAALDDVIDATTIDNYFPHSKDLFECDPWEVHDLQGTNDLYFIGGTVNFESVEHILRYNNYILDTHF